ncbi:uncharacterized protein Z518_03914 [Rhinocladiella mackenziei CBS 650.93]|uniref:Rhinocladiella mackenziei CBS 650.93 unplaced genomic scaffold supercont1.3, whole genome shotgun sequence n=1 Tax=Rhinocladiella mackenziei CBS 650.93 TaxID=1442369 RepID=A0A0D2J9Z7_9EURO|nr:uncharacterized protein Z518_03914 [Rhinocladiella mackenziei CBS 650.93]KIX05940.1 hypothetical protein Z518_03914 [Rhinocladiella mackenziei CBS 650.93]
MVGLYDSLDAVFRAFVDQSHGFSHQSPTSAELNVVIRTASVFARVDPFIASCAWNASGNETPQRFQEHVKEGFAKIGKDVTVSQIRNNAEAIDKVLEISEVIEKMVKASEPPEENLYHTADEDFAKSNLDARVVLGARVRNGLKILVCALIQQLHCCDNGHFLRLKLSGFINEVDAQSRLFFDAYLSSQYIWKPPRWVQSRCIIANDTIKTPECHGCHILRNAEERNENLSILLEEAPIRQREYGTQEPQKVDYLVSQTTKIQLEGCSPLSSAAAPTKSLWELLKQGEAGCDSSENENSETFFPEDREMICLNLALSLLPLSTTHWRRASWTSDGNTGEGIFFLRDPATQKIVDKTHPYLSYRLHDRPKSEDDDSLICDPQLLDFAKLIMEIRMWKRLPLSHKAGKLSKEQLRLYLLNLINDRRRFRDKDGMFKRAVKACLDAAGKEATRDEANKDRARNYVFDKIVRPLDSYAEFPEFSTSEPTDSPTDNSEGTQDPLFDWKAEYNTPEDKLLRAQDFLNRMDQFIEKHIRNQTCDEPLPKHRSQKIRIAVIDSGLSKDDPVIRHAREHDKIRKCRNFSSPDYEDWDDKLGHGTIVTRLLLDVAPEAELFIAKVTINGEQYIPKSKLHCIAKVSDSGPSVILRLSGQLVTNNNDASYSREKAINWAVQVWNVDIITISLALHEENPDIDEALNEALDPSYVGATRKIVFAAAGNNSGGNARRSWPARKDGVIAVHVTDGLGTAVNINPSNEGDVCFATLGCGIKHTWYNEDDQGEVYISGTSFATPIAVGIAANVMEYARRRVDDLNEERKKRLYSAGCMKQIFRAMSDKRGDYYYVQPWTFWNDRIRGGRWRNRDFPINDPDNIGLALKYIITDY